MTPRATTPHSPAMPLAAASTSSTLIAASFCSSRPARCRTRGASDSRSIHGSIASFTPGSQGARRDPSRAPVEQIEIRPGELILDRPGATGRLSVIARFANGDETDVTLFCEFRVRDDAVALVSPRGDVCGVRPGDTAIAVSYNDRLASVRVSVPTGRVVSIPDAPECDAIDREIFAKLRSLGIAPSTPAADAEFLRRVTVDLIGTLPSPNEVRAFLSDVGADKRSKKIDELLAHPMHAALWATRFLDITGCDITSMEGPNDLRAGRAQTWHDWFRKRIAENTPYSDMRGGLSRRRAVTAALWTSGLPRRPRG